MKIIYNCILINILMQTTSVFAGSEYRNVVADMLRDTSLTGSSIAVLDFSYSDGRDSRDGVVVSIKLNPSKHSSFRKAVARLNTKLIGN